MPQPADWYADPSGRYNYRYWDGSEWTNQVSSGGASALDPNPLAAPMVNTPPAPNSQAVPVAPKPQPPTQPAVQVSQRSGGMGFGVVLGALVAVAAIIVLVVVLASGSDDDTTDTTVPGTTTEEPAPDPTSAPEE